MAHPPDHRGPGHLADSPTQAPGPQCDTLHRVTTREQLAEGPLEALRPGPILLYDGECGVCTYSVQWVLAHESTENSGSLRFAPLQSDLGEALRRQAGVAVDVDSLLWVESLAGQVGVGAKLYADSVIEVLRHVGGGWSILAGALTLIPRPLRNWGYRLFARHRQKVVSRQCLVPAPEVRARFLGPL